MGLQAGLIGVAAAGQNITVLWEFMGLASDGGAGVVPAPYGQSQGLPVPHETPKNQYYFMTVLSIVAILHAILSEGGRLVCE